MNEEEKKAIKCLKTHNILVFEPYLPIILSLIEKQQKEIEYLKSEKEVDYISKEKIREILNNTEKNIEEDRTSIVLESLILNIKELLGE